MLRFGGWYRRGTILCHSSKWLNINVFKGKRHFDIVEVASSSLVGRFFLLMECRTCDLERGSRIKITGVAVIFTTRGEVLLALGEADRRRTKA